MKPIEHISWDRYTGAVHWLSLCIERAEFKWKDQRVYNLFPIYRGGLVPAVCLSHRLNLPINMCRDFHSLIVDDIVDTGETAKAYRDSPLVSVFYRSTSASVPWLYGELIEHDRWLQFPWEVS